MEPIARESLEELKSIFSWIEERESSLEDPITVLVGGWAVHSYNDYWGSIDIDLITNSRTKKSLKKFLLDHCDYRPDPETTKSVFKDTIHGKVIIDIANRGDDRFEGYQDSLKLNIVDGQTEFRDLEGQKVPVPTRSVMLMMKFKAAWDRGWRVRNNKSGEPEWDRSKMYKDHSDILALIDPKKNGEEVDVALLGKYFSDHPFIIKVLDDISISKPAFTKYGMDPKEGEMLIERFRSLGI